MNTQTRPTEAEALEAFRLYYGDAIDWSAIKITYTDESGQEVVLSDFNMILEGTVQPAVVRGGEDDFPDYDAITRELDEESGDA